MRRIPWFLCSLLALATCGREPLDSASVDPSKALRQIIAEQQRRHVRGSWGPLAGQCFTWVDLERFTLEARHLKIAQGVKGDRRFLEVALRLKTMTAPERRLVMEEARVPLRPTWAQLGRIDRSGQTEAGQQAEIMIADAIVALLEELVERRTDDDIH